MLSCSTLCSQLHRQTVLWSLYRPLLRAPSTLPLEQQQRHALQDYVRVEFKRHRHMKSEQRAKRKVVEGEQFLDEMNRAANQTTGLKRFRQLADYLLARRAAVPPPPSPPKPAPSPPKPRPRPSIIHSTPYHPPMQRLRPQPPAITRMILNRRRATQKRFDKLAIAKAMVSYGQEEDALDAAAGVKKEGEESWSKEWGDWIKGARRKEAVEFRRNEPPFRFPPLSFLSTHLLSPRPTHPRSLTLETRSTMLFNRLTALSFLGLAATALALSHGKAASSHADVAKRADDSLFAEVDDLDFAPEDLLDYADEEELERRAYDELALDLAALPTTSANELTEADLHDLDKRCSSCSSGKASVSVEVELKTAFNTCHKKVKKLHSSIKSRVKKCGKRPSAIRVVAAVKSDIRALRISIAALGKVCLKVAAKRGKHGLSVKIVGKLLVSLLVAVHAALTEIIALIATAPLLVILLAGELLAISAQLVILCNALFGLLGHSLKVYVAGHLSGSLLAGFRSLGCISLLACLRI
ncbi:hypothetical protein JCM6882_002083 [Rhodosporidiobolus microsporus]